MHNDVCLSANTKWTLRSPDFHVLEWVPAMMLHKKSFQIMGNNESNKNSMRLINRKYTRTSGIGSSAYI